MSAEEFIPNPPPAPVSSTVRPDANRSGIDTDRLQRQQERAVAWRWILAGLLVFWAGVIWAIATVWINGGGR